MNNPLGTIEYLPSGRVHIVDSGEPDSGGGVPILLIHGLFGSVRWFDEVAEKLSTHRRVIRIDLRGHGYTGGDDGFDAQSQTRMIRSVLDHLKLDSVAVAGHSYGADCALHTALADRRVSHAIVINQAPDYRGTHLPPSLLAMPTAVRGFQRLAPATVINMVIGYAAFGPGRRCEPTTKAHVAAGHAANDFTTTNAALLKHILGARKREFSVRPLDSIIESLEIPTLIVHGVDDQLYHYAETAARYRAAGATTQAIANAGHTPQVEQPSAVAAAIDRFLRA